MLTLLLLSATLAAPRQASPAEAPPLDVLLITVDTLRPDALGWVAADRSTPALDDLARQGFRFPGAVSPAPVTQPAHTSLFTGLVPRRHGVRDNGRVLGPQPPTLAEKLRRHGYRTAAFVSGYPLTAEFGLDRGFDHYDDDLGSGAAGRLERPAAATVAAVLDWLSDAGPGPWFLWVHFWDPHDPYSPPPAFASDGPRGGYHGEVAYVDHAFGELRRGLAERGLGGQRLLTVFTADHGESLGEHGEHTHGFFIYDSTVAVPLVFHLPGRISAGESRAAARLIDVAPTILEIVDLPPFAGDVDGASLTPWLAGRSAEMPAAVIETRRPWLSYGWSPLTALRHGTWKLIAAPRPELYDLARDPGETDNLIHRERAQARRLRALLRAAEEAPAAGSQAREDPETMARLRSLGYVGAGSDPGEPPRGAKLDDPKDRLELWNALSAALAEMERGEPLAAVAAFDAVLEQDPRNPFAWSRSGAALLAVGDPAAAVPRLRRAAQLSPDDAETRSALATALTRTGDYAAAAEQWLELVRLRPRRARAWINLAVSLGRSGKSGEAIDALTRAVELAPERPDLRLRLALAHHGAGDRSAAQAVLRDALAIAPELRPQIEADPALSDLLE